MTLIRPRPFTDSPSLREAMDRLFDRSFVTPGEWMTLARFEQPAIDVVSKPDSLVVKAALPGVKLDDIETTITGDTLTIRGTYREVEKKEEEGYLFRELSRGEFRRVISLPGGVDAEKAEATFRDGILTLTIPKVEPIKPHEIKVKSV
ncbi:MAG TPA: Hsp20/alpha crystallin family protein [Candidatus Limnocylindria bacterium]|nr:Hsp20/alpha crystallin family protein [Candidatus Limnocylindria bacterium]